MTRRRTARDVETIQLLAEEARSSHDAFVVLHDALLSAYDVPSAHPGQYASLTAEYVSALERIQELTERTGLPYELWFLPHRIGAGSAFLFEQLHGPTFVGGLLLGVFRPRAR